MNVYSSTFLHMQLFSWNTTYNKTLATYTALGLTPLEASLSTDFSVYVFICIQISIIDLYPQVQLYIHAHTYLYV